MRLACILLLALAGCGGGDPAPLTPSAALLKEDLQPVVSSAIFVHGGGWTSGSPDAARPLVVRFGVWGYAMDSAFYRLIPEVTLADEVADVAAEIERVRAGSAAPMIVVGHSAGAHLAATAVLQANKGLPVCLILLDGIGYDMPDLLTRRPGLQDRLLLTPDESPPLSPVHLLGPEDAPVRIFAAAGNDSRDTAGEAKRMVEAAVAAGLSAEYRHYPEMDHTDFLSHFQEAPPSEFLKAVRRFVDGCAWRPPV